MKTSRILFTVIALGLPACAPPTVPNRPSWDDDVMPILQGSCNHCHGDTVGRGIMGGPVFRYDICDPAPFMEAGIPLPPMAPGAANLAPTFAVQLKPMMAGRRPLMPPPPAALLSDYERDVLLKWGDAMNTDRCRRASRNRAPNVRVIGKPEWDGGDVKVEVEVTDPDGDQVLGKVSVGQASSGITSSGRRVVTVVGAREGDPINIIVHDGWDSRTLDI
jgi:hypothetical protein